jgi:hypothetical protein
MPQSLFLWGKSPWYSLDRRLSDPQNSLDPVVRRRKSQPLLEVKPVRPKCSLVTIPTDLLQLLLRQEIVVSFKSSEIYENILTYDLCSSWTLSKTFT